MTQQQEKMPWVVVAPTGVYWLGHAHNEKGAWTDALGWPDEEEVAEHKRSGWYAAEAAVTWKRPAGVMVPEAPRYQKLVSVDITEAMHAAAVRTIVRCTGNDDFPRRVWAAMFEAAPDLTHGVTAAPAPVEPAAWMHEFTDPHSGNRYREPRVHKPADFERQPGDTVRPLAYADGVREVVAPSKLLTPRAWQMEAITRAAKLTGTPEGALAVVEAKRYGLMADELERIAAGVKAGELAGLPEEIDRASGVKENDDAQR